MSIWPTPFDDLPPLAAPKPERNLVWYTDVTIKICAAISAVCAVIAYTLL